MADYSYLQNPTPDEFAQWGIQKRRLTEQLGQGRAQIAFKRANTQQQQGLEQRMLTQKYDQTRERLPGGFARRGLLNSGVYGHALQNYGMDRANAFSQLAQRYQQSLGQMNLDQQQLEQAYMGGMADVNDLERARRATLAAQLKALQG